MNIFKIDKIFIKFWQNLMQVALLVCFKTLPYLQINNVDFHESRECDSQSLVPSFPCTSPPNFNVRKTVHVESQEVTTTLQLEEHFTRKIKRNQQHCSRKNCAHRVINNIVPMGENEAC